MNTFQFKYSTATHIIFSILKNQSESILSGFKHSNRDTIIPKKLKAIIKTINESRKYTRKSSDSIPKSVNS